MRSAACRCTVTARSCFSARTRSVRPGKVCVSTIESIIIFHVGARACVRACVRARALDIIPFALPRRRGQPEAEELAALRYPALLDSFDPLRLLAKPSRENRRFIDIRTTRWTPPRPSLGSTAGRNIKTHEIRSFNIGILGIALYSPNNPSPAGRPAGRPSANQQPFVNLTAGRSESAILAMRGCARS